ncbi:alkaline phosphatase family protein [Kutzneria sp. CA-103260]|uniref:alkaline phosphatase family protein n=1 Tax=Kutzneria sp. CA-103260 TaxID=2802641 RepID=UPI001BA878EB|nr:alkaline phosphatase family protein [Kutzneria sp. CA-103260]QUQ65655.1 type I phosphodiesterase/nucleotide pyrophosphatase [Kutzneria sp. CA-103260]
MHRTPLVVAAAVSLLAASVAPATAAPRDRHVLLISVDGLHATDLAWYVRQHPNSALAKLTRDGVDYSHAKTPVPSDSFPGMVGQLTGGDPATTGIYYDATYNHALLPAGTTTCAGAKPGAEVDLTEDLDKDKTALDAGQGLAGLPNSILGMTGQPQALIQPSALPVDPATCKPVQPNQYLKVNTVFEVARAAGLRTAWSDKHPAYAILNGPSGTGIQDLFTPEINSNVGSGDWTTDNNATRQYDHYKVLAVRNEIDGYDHSGATRVGTPAVFGLNFQTVSTAQKLPAGGYLADGTPGPLLSSALDSVNSEIGSLTAELAKQHLTDRTTIILSAKHGQSPTDPTALTRIADGPLLDGLNAAWKAAHPGSGDLVAYSTDDDAMLLWLNDRSAGAFDFAQRYLLAQNGTGNGITGAAKPFTASGLASVHTGPSYFHTAAGDPRVPDLVGVAQYGVVYTGKKSKIAEHGGAAPDDRDVALVVSGAGVCDHQTVDAPVTTTQIAPTILTLLGLNPNTLQAVRIEHTRPLPRA